ncbi:hypothetical protein SAMN05216351_10472 [Pseudobutyrivibrio sp. JW11]|uniref:helix-turn-helix transcriptional regulator n=1 Tax=Pseudobutyrivibrio sp. JW11 TaxID=1855302 RepID=UPI0008E2DB11|nr:helix-turn-helix transcriptional regulator [Pseudobutyrivibrio sp. JW11]SFO18292.1 hypothetical protein SAMN05216351_10472 [Pseudobutyrivibrio sp. JW11]
MLKDKNENRIEFDGQLFKQLMKNDKRTAESIKKEIAEKAHVSDSAVNNWQYGYNFPADIETVEIIAQVLDIDSRILIKQIPQKQDLPSNKDDEESYTDDSGNMQDNVFFQNTPKEEELYPQLSWDEIRSYFKRKPFLRYHIERILLLLFNYHFSFIEKINIFYLGKDGDESLRKCLSLIVSQAIINSQNDMKAFRKGDWQIAVAQRKILNNKMSFLEVNKGFLVAYLNGVIGFEIKNINIVELFWGLSELTPELWNELEWVLNEIEKARLEKLFPIHDLKNAIKFKSLNAIEAANYVTRAIPAIISSNSVVERKTRANELLKYGENSGIKYFFNNNMKTLSDTSIFELHTSFVSAAGCPIVMNDNSYRGDINLKERLETYAYENNVPIIYLKEA